MSPDWSFRVAHSSSACLVCRIGPSALSHQDRSQGAYGVLLVNYGSSLSGLSAPGLPFQPGPFVSIFISLPSLWLTLPFDTTDFLHSTFVWCSSDLLPFFLLSSTFNSSNFLLVSLFRRYLPPSLLNPTSYILSPIVVVTTNDTTKTQGTPSIQSLALWGKSQTKTSLVSG